MPSRENVARQLEEIEVQYIPSLLCALMWLAQLKPHIKGTTSAGVEERVSQGGALHTA
jgi:hypothetical protein